MKKFLGFSVSKIQKEMAVMRHVTIAISQDVAYFIFIKLDICWEHIRGRKL
jgi:hypothetical protein